ncbi:MULTISPECIES: DNA recombination protein RmuC [Spongiibacter]|uniref:DNA recombination protein RmuC n=1 Tax=Spongiibacter TaxID=630749 RepID=UPI00235456A8|nr:MULTISPECIES: DNA recombination protein RmuC [Spongiibacter]|tara:strand:- start:24389 stop:25828 length:1440 start_codon:yes stop_codon:yes gene_type:complete
MNDINLFALLAGALCIAAGLMLGLLLSRRQQKLQEGRITALEEELQSLNQRLTTASQEREQLQASLNAALQQKAVAESSLSDVSQRLAHSEQQRSDADRAKADAQAALARKESDYRHLQESSSEQIALLKQAREELSRQFEQLANRIFDEKSRRFSEANQQNLQQSLNPFREQLKGFQERVNQIYDIENRQHGELREQLKSLQDMNANISREAQNLTRALKGDNKAQGNWGEVILERVLEESGLRKGHEYETQLSFTNDEGRRSQPDVIVRLPDEKDIIIDAKVSLIAYERYCSAESESERREYLKAHIQSVRQHIAGLSTKAYQHIEGIRTLDFVFIFIPVEAAFMTAFEHDPELFRNAYEQNIIVVGPTTLLATLRTVQSIWRYERQNLNAEKIAREAGALHDQFALVVESLEDIGKHLDRGQSAYEKTIKRMTEGRGNLVGRVARLEQLGAKVKKTLPTALTERADVQQDDSDDND